MKARSSGTCACGCRQPFPVGEEIERGTAGWTRTACRAPAAPAPAPSTTWFASPAEVLQVLTEARAVRDRGGPAGQPAMLAQGARR